MLAANHISASQTASRREIALGFVRATAKAQTVDRMKKIKVIQFGRRPVDVASREPALAPRRMKVRFFDAAPGVRLMPELPLLPGMNARGEA